MKNAMVVLALAALVGLLGCDRKADTPTVDKSPPSASSPAAPKNDEHGHTHGDHPPIELGTAKIGGFDVKAARDEGVIKAGGDAALDVWIGGGTGDGVVAVRFWIGTEDGKGSVKAKAEIEKDHWHTHAEIPDPLPADARFWVEIETATAKPVGSFELKP